MQARNVLHLGCAFCCILTSLDALNVLNNIETVVARDNKLPFLTLTNKSKLKNLYLKGNSSMTSLSCNNNALKNLELTGCTALQILRCYENPNLTAITGLGDCTKMSILTCYGCSLSSLSAVANMPNLTDLRCGMNSLTSLDVSNKTKLGYLYCESNNLTSLNLTGCSALVDIMCGGNQFTQLNLFGNNKLQSFDCVQSKKLQYLYITSNPVLNKIKVTGCTAMTSLQCSHNAALTTIEGLGGCSALKTLQCTNTAITALTGVSNLVNLETLDCQNTKLTSLTITNKGHLSTLHCQDNPTLTQLYCHTNALSILDITNNTGLTDLRCYYNSPLTSIKGLTTCRAITYLDCEDCAITSLDLSYLDNLEKLYARNNKITGTFQLNNKAKLKYIRLSGNTRMTGVVCNNNHYLTELYLANCTALKTAEVGNNDLETLDVTGCTALSELNCGRNNLTSLNLSSCTALTKLWCYYNKLLVLNLDKCTKLSLLHCFSNNIKGANMNIMINSLPTRMASSPGDFHVITNSNEYNNISASQVINARKKYWIPMRFNGSEWVEIEANLVGDVNGDDEVNIADVNALIDMVLKNKSSDAADVNGDGEVNIADVNVLIDMILKM